MLEQYSASTMIPVRDLQAARHFYREVLGLPEGSVNEEQSIEFRTGGVTFNIYASAFAGTNQGTAMSWTVPVGIEKVVDALRQRGVRFEHYDIPGLRLEGDIHTGEQAKMAWFKDPDGNILCIANA